MKIYQLTLLVFVSGLVLTSCDEAFDHTVVPNGNVTTRQESFSNYSKIDVSHAFSVYVSFSDTEESIEIEANDNLHQYIEVYVENDRLHIGLERNINIRGSATLTAYITTRHIADFSASGATRFVIEDPIVDEDVSIYLSGASLFSANLDADRVYVDLSGASLVNVSGEATYCDVDISGASAVKDYDFNAHFLKADLSGASSMSLTVMDEIDIEASGASTLHYKGPAVITHQNLSGASHVKHHQ